MTTTMAHQDPELEAEVRNVVGLYPNPSETTIVLCVDEKTRLQQLNRIVPILPLFPACQRKPPRLRIIARQAIGRGSFGSATEFVTR